jgi:glycosyltransferase involved in cell wall biosynthesis
MSQKLKIAVFHLAFVYSGGGEKLVIEQVRGLRKNGHQVDCFAPIIDQRACFPDLLPEIGVKEIIPGASWFFSRWPTMAILLTCLLMPVLAWRFRGYDVLIGANQPGPWFGYLINKFFKIPYLVYLAQPTRILYPRLIDRRVGLRLKGKLKFLPILINIFKPFIWWADNVSIRQASKMLVNGKYIGGVLEKVYGREAIICPAGCYPLLAKELKFKSRWQAGFKIVGQRIQKPFILLTNRHSPAKKFEWTIEAMDRVWRRFPKVELVITGQENRYTARLKKLARENRDLGKIKFLGLVSDKDLSRLYSESALYVYSSPEEDFGMGMVEAMAHGAPVVAWDNAGPTGIVINQKTGFLAQPFDLTDYAQKIILILADQKLAEKMGRAGWKRAKKNFSYQKHCRTIEKALFDYNCIKPQRSKFRPEGTALVEDKSRDAA